jgi:monothiol glutaredoxin
MSMDDALRAQIEALLAQQPIMLFMKGSPQAPQCGFSATVVQILDHYGVEFGSVDVLSAPEIRAGIKEFSAWPTIPQLYVDAEFLGGCDIVSEMHEAGELADALGSVRP